MTEPFTPDELEPTEDQARSISKGRSSFATEREVTVVPGAIVNRILVVAVIGLSIITITAIVCLTVFSIARADERRSFNGVVAALSRDLAEANAQRDSIRQTLDETQRSIQCRAQSQADVDSAQATMLLVIALQFASAVDQTPPPPDPAIVNDAALKLQQAIDSRQVAVASCG
jgi:hypothetical protein